MSLPYQLGMQYSLLRYPYNNTDPQQLTQTLGCKWFRVDVPWISNAVTQGAADNWAGLQVVANPSAALTTGAPITSIELASVPAAIASGQMLTISTNNGANTQELVCANAVAASTTSVSVPIASVTPNYAYPSTSAVYWYNLEGVATMKALGASFAQYGVSMLWDVNGNIYASQGTDYPSSSAQYATDLAWLAGQFPGQHWELDNEPDQAANGFAAIVPAAYVSMMTAAYPAMKAADLTCVVHNGPVSNQNGASSGFVFKQSCYEAMADFWQLYDVDGCHDYQYPGNQPATALPYGHTMAEYWATFQALRAQYGDTRPLWLTETGWESLTTNSPVANSGIVWPEMTQPLQAQYLQQWLLILADMAGAPEVVIPYAMTDNSSQTFGLTTYPNTPKQSYQAVLDLLPDSNRFAQTSSGERLRL